MSKIIFYHGTMNSSKSAQLLMQNYNYKEQGLNTLLIKPTIDTRDGANAISSRIGLKEESNWSIKPESSYNDIMYMFGNEWVSNGWINPDVILIDEAQFLSYNQIKSIIDYARDFEIEVHAFGLLKDFTNHLFEGSKALIELSDNLVEVKTTCSKCTRKATCNLRLSDGLPVYEGETIQIGGNESYVSVCAKHYNDYYAED